MRLKKIMFSLMVLGTCASVYANNFDYCYSKEKGLDEECYARKQSNTEYYNNRRYEHEDRRYDRSDRRGNTYVVPGPVYYDENGRFVPTPIPQRMPYILPGMY